MRWNAFTPQVLSPSASAATRSVAARRRLQSDLQGVVPGAWVGRTFANVGWSVVAVPASQKKTALAKLRATYGARNVEAVHSRHVYRTPNDPQFGSQWWLAKIGAPQAWDTATGSASVAVAVVDTGVQLAHPDLAGELTGGFNAFSPGTPPEDDASDSHGTHVAGIIGARGNNGLLVSGVNWQTRIVPVKVFDASGNGDDPTIAAGIDYVLGLKARGVNIRALNASWGGPDTSQVLQDAFAALDRAGILSFVAAGNGDANGVGYSIDARPDYPSAYTFPTIVSVAASDANDARASFSNYGAQNVDIFAPGTNILSLARGGGVQYLDGTSMSTPMATGAAALLWSIKPSLSAAQMKALLLQTSFQAPALSGVCASNGRLDVAAAVASLLPKPTPTPTPKPTATPAPTPRPTATPAPSGQLTLVGTAYSRTSGVLRPLAGVEIYLNNGFVTRTDSNGAYSVVVVRPGLYVIKARLSGYRFAPAWALLNKTAGTVRRDLLGVIPPTPYALPHKGAASAGTS